MKIGRNDPCPCGSGKKYKNCCLKEKITSGLAFPRRAMKDYGLPTFSNDFFEKNPIKEISAARLLYSTLLNPEIDQLASEVTKQFIRRGEEEAKRIKEETNPENLIHIMEQEPDPFNHRILKERILNFWDFTLPRIIERLRNNRNDAFAELAVEVIYESKLDCGVQLLEILNSIEDPYTCSLVCLLLGLMGPRDGIQHIWNYYHFFTDEYAHETYDQGPLLALYKMKERFSLK
jgi:hypothetical protein